MTAESVRLRAEQGHVSEEATIDHLIRSLYDGKAHGSGRVLSPVTETGLTIEEQLRKTWNRPITGLAVY